MSEKMGQLDIVFVVDNTGSMGPYIQNVKTKILEIIRTIKKEELCHRLRVGLVSYRDHPPEETTYITQKFELTSDTATIEQNVMKMDASGGGDGPEAVSTALQVMNKMEYLNESAKIAVLIGDAPPHGVESGDRWPQGTPDGAKWDKEAKKAFEKGIVIHTVGCFPEITNYENGVATYEKIAGLSQGRFIPLEKAELLVNIITGLAVEEIDKIAIQKSILEDLGVSMEDFPADEEFTEAKISEIVAKVQAKGVTKRAMAARSSSAPAARSEDLAVEAQEVDEADIREAVRQLKSKSGK
ncbi:MAG: VWA domain-containing protein [Candidatus Thorarchaeota archaeon]|nr:MAG: VWA domain-containing protein [Candidatus Thorarchaeota archaeon]